jgi:hypothetical protein
LISHDNSIKFALSVQQLQQLPIAKVAAVALAVALIHGPGTDTGQLGLRREAQRAAYGRECGAIWRISPLSLTSSSVASDPITPGAGGLGLSWHQGVVLSWRPHPLRSVFLR